MNHIEKNTFTFFVCFEHSSPAGFHLPNIICPDMNFEDFSGSLKQIWMFFMDGNHKTVTKNDPKPKKRIMF